MSPLFSGGNGDEARKANERFDLVALATGHAVWDWDLATDALWWSQGFYRLFGYDSVEPGIESWSSRVHPDERAHVVDGIHRAIDEGGRSWTDQYRFLRADGTWAEILDRGFIMRDADGKPVRMVGAMMDVSETRHAERAQAALTRVAEAAAESADLGELLRAIHAIVAELLPAKNFFIALLLPDGEHVEFPYYVDQLDAAPDGPEKLERGLTAYVLRTGKSFLLRTREQAEDMVRRGELVVVGSPAASWLGVPLRVSQRTIGVLVAQSYDPAVRHTPRDEEILQFVSTQIARAIERKRAEEALRDSERRFRALIQNSSDGIMVFDRDGRVTFHSAAVDRILGLGSDAEPRLDPVVGLAHPDDVQLLKREWRKTLARPGKPVQNLVRLRHRTGVYRTVEYVATNLLDDPAVRGVVANFRDITDRKLIEAKLLAADRMVSIGTLAAAVAHEINNPLAYAIGNLSLISDGLSQARPLEAPDLREALEAARDGTERVRNIVRGLRTFSRGGDDTVDTVDVHRVLDEAIQIAGNEVRQRAQIVRAYAQGLPTVRGNEGRMGQVFLNLIVNAAQAIPEGAAQTNEIRLSTSRDQGRVVVEVQDTGSGIPPHLMPRLFDPFFTTKPAGVGTGLGLFICKSIVDSMGGDISVRAAPDRGTVFRISVPAGTGEAKVPQAVPAAAPSRGRVLVVDDEVQIGRVLKRALAAHEVTCVGSAVEGLTQLRGGAQYDLVLCDLMMPGMTGMDLHAVLVKEFPPLAARMIFLTGGAFTATARSFLDAVPNDRFEKPFDLAAVRAKVAEKLGAK